MDTACLEYCLTEAERDAFERDGYLVVADALSIDVVRKAGPKRLREVRVVSRKALDRLKDALTVVVPRVMGGPAQGATGKRSGRSAST